MGKRYFVYTTTNKHNTVLYTGVTNNRSRRIFEHQTKTRGGFTSKYSISKLVYLEEFGEIGDAIAREKQIKGGSRQRKIDLINSINPEWRDLFEE